MRRWNGWGDTSVMYHFPANAARYLAQMIGDGAPTPDAPFEQVVASVPPSRLARHALISTDAAERARVIPYGGGTSVVGHINPRPGNALADTLIPSCLSTRR